MCTYTETLCTYTTTDIRRGVWGWWKGRLRERGREGRGEPISRQGGRLGHFVGDRSEHMCSCIGFAFRNTNLFHVVQTAYGYTTQAVQTALTSMPRASDQDKCDDLRRSLYSVQGETIRGSRSHRWNDQTGLDVQTHATPGVENPVSARQI